MRVKGALRLISTLFYGFILLLSLSIRLLWIWLTVDWKIWKTRRGFEKEIVRYGVSKHDAKKLSAQYATFKKNLKRLFMQSFKRINASHV
ncbi:hypothetical protein KEJ34_06880 [Candidatus Bathyarchaeota archaeon]|nr:hypothetical protein [Candidatus Bathyarchaeota archaeon]